MRTFTTMSLLMLTGMAVLAAPTLGQTDPAAEPDLTPTWFNPQKPEAGTIYPLAVMLKSDAVPEAGSRWWLSTLYAQNFCQCVLTTPSEDFSDVSVPDVMRIIDPLPGNVPADGRRLVIIADKKTASLARRLIEAFPDRIAGAVFVNAPVTEIRRSGRAGPWLPREEARRVPLWVVVGTAPGEASAVLNTWRQFRVFMPPNASITIDTRLGRGLDYVLPDQAIVDWLSAIRKGEMPGVGPDAQAQEGSKLFAGVTQAVGELLKQRGFVAPTGQRLVKTDGPMTVSVNPPQGWQRSAERENKYNPTGKVVDETGAELDVAPNPFLQIGLVPDPRSPRYALAMATPWTRSGADLITYANKRLTSRGYIAFPLQQWTSGDWAIELTAYANVYKDSWNWWIGLSAARDAQGDEVAVPLIMLLSRADPPDPRLLVSSLNRLRQTVQVEWTGPLPADASRRIED